MSDIVLKLDQLCKQYPSTCAVKNVSLELKRGQVYGLVGRVTSGKTTLMQLISGWTEASSGSISLLGSASPGELRLNRRRLGTMVGKIPCHEDLSITANLRAQAMIIPKEHRANPKELCRLVGIDRDFTHHAIRRRPQEQRVRYGLAAALLNTPELLLLDEPFTGLHDSDRVELGGLLRKLSEEQGITILVSAPLLTPLYGIATDFLFMRRGEVLESISQEEMDARIKEERIRNVEDYFAMVDRR